MTFPFNVDQSSLGRHGPLTTGAENIFHRGGDSMHDCVGFLHPNYTPMACFPLRTNGRISLLALMVVGLMVPARGTTVDAPEFAELVNQSDYIVRAVVKSVSAEYARPDGRKIITKVGLEVREVIAGIPPQPLVLTMLGGRIGGREMIVEGVPQFRVGEEHILFVQGNGRQIYPLVAMMHGVYPIQRAESDEREFVTRSNRVPLQSTAEVALPMTAGGAAELQRRLKSSGPALDPAEFVRQIRAAVKPDNPRLRER